MKFISIILEFFSLFIFEFFILFYLFYIFKIFIIFFLIFFPFFLPPLILSEAFFPGSTTDFSRAFQGPKNLGNFLEITPEISMHNIVFSKPFSDLVNGAQKMGQSCAQCAQDKKTPFLGKNPFTEEKSLFLQCAFEIPMFHRQTSHIPILNPKSVFKIILI